MAAARMWLGRQGPDRGIRARQGAEQLPVVRRQLVYDPHQLLDVGPQLGELDGFLGAQLLKAYAKQQWDAAVSRRAELKDKRAAQAASHSRRGRCAMSLLAPQPTSVCLFPSDAFLLVTTVRHGLPDPTAASGTVLSAPVPAGAPSAAAVTISSA
ncbi:hypothetical protein [Streptomyces monashensis]|uniref:hypothetical protein n=1 Tax=Streptomyces monashensis TaxID=1678012 RepID=UPI001C432D01|nr:hypothetical protein [Streptomyces monashensis]